MILEAQKKKLEEFKNQRNLELEEVEKLKASIEQEKVDKRRKIVETREAAQKVIQENILKQAVKQKEKQAE